MIKASGEIQFPVLETAPLISGCGKLLFAAEYH